MGEHPSFMTNHKRQYKKQHLASLACSYNYARKMDKIIALPTLDISHRNLSVICQVALHMDI